MKKYKKLQISAFLLVISAVMVVAVSYAALTMSTNPALEKLHVSVGGSHTIQVAPDMTYTDANGNVYHYPGAFSDHMNFSDFAQYDYLGEVAGLVPVSTADGLRWYLPTYYQRDDALVQSGMAIAGQLRPTTDFLEDVRLEYANLYPQNGEMVQQGHYIYLDFWVVAPVNGYELRVSDGDDGIGTYVIDLIEPEATDTGSGVEYTLTGVNQQAAASIRIGFLVSDEYLVDESMHYYSQSPHYDSRFTRLQGYFSEPGQTSIHSDGSTHFTIFEPNGDLHPDSAASGVVDGQYVVTQPLGPGGVPMMVNDRLTVQLRSSWIMAQDEPLLAQMFETFLRSKNLSQETLETLRQGFYNQYLLYPYINKGNFIANTGELYNLASLGLVSAEQIQSLHQAGATEDVVITNLTGGIPQRIRMFIWLEGQDVDCVNSVATSGLAISIELAGGDPS